MIDLRAYRIGLAAVLAALFVIAFSLRGLPEPLPPAAETVQLRDDEALATARALERASPERAPGSEDAATAARLVADDLAAVGAGAVAQQELTGSAGSGDVRLRNVVLVLPGSTDRAIAVVAPRNASGPGGSSAGAAATGALVELATQLGGTSRDRTLVVASIDGAGTERPAIDAMLEALPERIEIEAGLAISQPAADPPSEPHLLISSGTAEQPSPELVQTAAATLGSRAQADAGLDGPLGQIARLALPGATGAQAALLERGIDAVAISGAGEAVASTEQLSEDSLDRFGSAALALVAALDASPGPPTPGTERYLRIGDNTTASWSIAVLALALLVPPGLAGTLALRRDRGAAGVAWAQARGWVLVALAPLLFLYVLALLGLLPRPEVPFGAARFEIGVLEVIALITLAGAAVGVRWALGLRATSAEHGARLAASALMATGACVLAWTVNPFLALVLAPLAHIPIAFAVLGRGGASLVAALAALPLAGTVLHAGGALGWGLTAPWQLVLLVSGGGLGPLEAVATAGVLGSVAAALSGARTRQMEGRHAPQDATGGQP